jgi:hypothetical protein
MVTFIQNIGSNIYNYFLSENNSNNCQLLEPLCCIIKLSMLNLKEEGTKLQIVSNSIKFQEPDILQGTSRWLNGDTRSDLHNLCNPIQIALEWYNPSDTNDLRYIYGKALKGIDALGVAYNINTVSSLVGNTIAHYRILIHRELDKTDKTNKHKGVDETSNESVNEPEHKYKNLWTKDEIKIIKSLLEIAVNKKEKNEDYHHYLDSIENILDDKDNKIREILIKSNTKI